MHGAKMFGRSVLLVLLLFSAKRLCVMGAQEGDESSRQFDKISMDQLLQVLEFKSMVNQIQHANDEISDRLAKMDVKLESFTTQVLGNSTAVKLPECEKWLQWADLNKTNSFSAFEKQFYYNKTWVHWQEASDWCTEKGMRLASLPTLTEVDAVIVALANSDLSESWLWLSATDIGRKPGEFHWSDGTPVYNSTWLSEPDDFGEGLKTCVALSIEITKLTDWSCSSNSFIMCEVPAALTSCFKGG